MHDAYCRLHLAGWAHSVEIYDASGTELLGGLYGVASGGVFCGESMFSRAPDTSKMALVALAYHLKAWGFVLIDCQMANPYLISMGAETISRAQFVQTLLHNLSHPFSATWQVDPKVDLSHWEPAP